MADRSITIYLPRIRAEDRQSEETFWSAFRDAQPEILGALLDGVSAALRNAAQVHFNELPRMADFTIWTTAAESGLGFAPGALVEAYEANQRNVVMTAFEADPLAVTLIGVMEKYHPTSWEGTATQLLEELNTRVEEGTKKSYFWPKSPSALGSRIDRLSSIVESKGWSIRRWHSGSRHIVIARIGEPK